MSHQAGSVSQDVADFLTELERAGTPDNTIRAYRGDLAGFVRHSEGGPETVGVEQIHDFLAVIADQAPSTQKRKRASIAAFCRWAVRDGRLNTNPMHHIDAIVVPKKSPRLVPAADIYRVLDSICPRRPPKDMPIDVLRDRVLFETIYQCGMRASQVCELDTKNLHLSSDDGYITVERSDGEIHHVLLTDRGYTVLFALYLYRAGIYIGPVFRASINGTENALSYSAAHHRWRKYCAAAGLDIELRELRHAHAAELLKAGIPLEAVRKRLGHASTASTQVYELLVDVDVEIRAAAKRTRR